MARKNSSTIADEELEATASEAARKNDLEDSPLDARMLDLDDEAESPFLRGQKRVPVRRGALPRNAASRVKLALIVIVVVTVAGAVWITLHRYATQSWRFRLDSSDNITISGNDNVSRSQILDVLASDIDRNLFFVPLDQRQKQLEQIPWVQSASVMRLLPNRLKIVIHERTPVAFVEIDSHIELIDASGVIMDLPANQSGKYSFPVIVGDIRRRSTVHPRGANEDLQPADQRAGRKRGALFRQSQRRRSFRSRRREGYGHRS